MKSRSELAAISQAHASALSIRLAGFPDHRAVLPLIDRVKVLPTSHPVRLAAEVLIDAPKYDAAQIQSAAIGLQNAAIRALQFQPIDHWRVDIHG